MRTHRLAAVVAVVLAVLATQPIASASLGGKIDSVQADRVHMQGALLQVTSAASYSVHEMRAASGTTVREFVTGDGTVFGVAWQGPAIPDLRQLLGSYFDTYIQEAQRARTQRHAHGPLSINTSEIVFQQIGQQRAFSGRAYVPSLMPANVLADVVK